MNVDISPEDLRLEQLCPVCKGYTPKTGKCSCCKNRGIIPTELGLHVLEFVLRQAKRFKDGEFKDLHNFHRENPDQTIFTLTDEYARTQRAIQSHAGPGANGPALQKPDGAAKGT